MALGANDMLRGIEPAVARDNLDAILAELAARDIPALLVGVSASGNFGNSYQADFDAIFPALSGTHDVALVPDFLQGLVDLGDHGLVVRRYLQGDGLHPNAEGVKLIVSRMGPAVLAFLETLE